MARVVQAVGRGGAQVIVPPTRVAWTFKPTLPQLPLRLQTKTWAINEEQVYADIVRQQLEAIVAVRDAMEWLDGTLSTP